MPNQEKNKAVIYCRVSTIEQVEEGNSLATQERMCKEYALKHNYEIAAIYIEEGESAKTIDRTELKKMITFCSSKKNNVSAIIAYKIDRISRNTDDYSQIRILLKRYGIEIKYTSENFENTPSGRFMENIIANVAQFDNEVRAERSVTGMKNAIREGRYVWQAPFGYSNVRNMGRATIEQNHLAVIVRKIFNLVATNQIPLEEIRKKVVPIGLPPKYNITLSKSHFYRIIKNELYAGWINKFHERHKGNFQPIISEELFCKVQKILISKRKNIQQRVVQNPDFPLRRFFRHSSGKSLTGAWSTGRKKKYPYYFIHKTDISIRRELLENTFQAWLNNFQIDITHFEKIYSYAKEHFESYAREKKNTKILLESKRVELKNKQTTVLNKNIDGVISNELCKEKLEEINSELYDIDNSLSLTSENSLNKEQVLKIIREVLSRPGDVWQKLDFEEKLKLQWFYFPDGIEIDTNGSRTVKICKLFKLKELISPYQSPNVTHRNQKSNTKILQLSLPPPNDLDIQGSEFWEGVKEEVMILQDILNKPKDLLTEQIILSYEN